MNITQFLFKLLHMDYLNASLPVEKRVDDLISRMTLEEKVGQMIQLPANEKDNMDKLESMHVGSYLHCSNEQMDILQRRAEKTRLGIPLIFGIDAIHGHCFENNGTVFPTQLAMSCSWDTELAEEVGRVTAKEVRSTGIHWTFSPVLCVGRDLRWGRVDETFGEDPWLIGELASAMIKGYQGSGSLNNKENILACAKHFAGYGETAGGRDAYEADISKRKMLNLFLPPFERVAKEGCASLMTAYQAIDGVPCTVNRWLLKETAKENWKYEGFIVTDWDNVGALHTRQMAAQNLREATKRAILAGNDMIMTTPDFYMHAIDLVKKGEVDEELINDSAKRILKAKFLLGLFDEYRHSDTSASADILGCKEHMEISYKASKESLVLLKNNGILPLDPDKTKRILLTGPNADDIIAQLGDWSFRSQQLHKDDDTFHADHVITLLQGLKSECARQNIEFNYIKGADTLDSNFNEIDKVKKAAKEADLVIACVGDRIELHGEFKDRGSLDLTGKQQELLEAIKETGTPLVTVLVASKPLTVPWIKENSDAVFAAFNPGLFGGKVITEALFGQINPQGKLTISFPYHVGQQPAYYNKYAGWHTENDSDIPGNDGYIDMPREPLWAFGEGMGYSAFSYENLSLEKTQLEQNAQLSFQIDVTNKGKVPGVEIVQVYINDIYSSVTTPVKELKAYKKIFLKEGETKRVTFSLDYNSLSLLDADCNRIVEPGEFELMVGASSKDEELIKTRFYVEN